MKYRRSYRRRPVIDHRDINPYAGGEAICAREGHAYPLWEGCCLRCGCEVEPQPGGEQCPTTNRLH